MGVTWKQAHDFCIWRTDRVNEKALIDKGYLNKNSLKSMKGGGQENFNTKTYLMGRISTIPGLLQKKERLKRSNGRPRKV